ncbi:MAG: hypothetical protein HY238_00725 [Acidobacteria bacterium]|nr:hypothetical protein [Acidobacteriota bacterium]
MRRPQTGILLLFCCALFLSSCGPSGPTPPKMGTPEWYVAAAREQFEKGDLTKTQEHLEKVMASDHNRGRVAAWYLVLLEGMAGGYRELAEAYDEGSTQTKTQSAEFRRTVNDVRRYSKQYCLTLAQELGRFQKESSGSNEVSLDFQFPLGSPVEDSSLGRIRKGMLPPDSERATAQRTTVARGVLLATASAVGAGEDTAKASEMFKTPPVKVPRVVFLLGMGENLVDESKVFDRKKLNEPEMKMKLLEMAAECAKPASESDDAALKKRAKALADKIAKEQKGPRKG